MLTVQRKAACAIYLAIAAVALIGTWGNNLDYVDGDRGFVDATKDFWRDTFVNAASRSITVDLGLLLLAAVVWMVFEAHRLQIKWVWLYVLFGGLIAISVTFPLFLVARERAAARVDGGQAAGEMTRLDLALLALVSAAVVAATVVSLTR